ncbi:hypothetical protein OH773_06725 [Buttiauxella sp. WJP83]|uniref:hypothetical protein n=1 Tax=Buttiauxella sp. WJP83 TaxID=2986951 RepID=UPI0022DD6B6A|nr:hypothetical protein [Buttiauxella sp. WJP83]WBM71929.1 hypothetical protein OH773_06725 [Buttiauxella sp. WJP83]
MSNEMYFDTSSFDFDSLTDIVGLNDNNGNPAHDKKSVSNNAKAYRDEIDDMSDLFPDAVRDEEEQEIDPNDDVSDLAINEPRNGANLTDYFRAADDNAFIDFEGLQLTKAQIKELYKSKTKVEHDSAYFSEQAKRFDEDNKMINQRYLMQATVLENNINVLTQRLNNPNITDSDYANYSRQLQQQQVAHQQLTNEVNQIMNTRSQQEQLVNGYRIRAADQELSNLYPEWNKYKTDVLSYAQSEGVNGNILEKVYDKPIMQMMLKAYLYDANKKRVAAEINNKTSQARNARSTSSANQSTRNQKVSEQDAAKAKAALSKMGSSRDHNVKAFDYLID